MRTRLDIETPVLEELRDLHRREGGTLGELVSRLLRDALDQRVRSPFTAGFEWTARPMGSQVDLMDKGRVYGDKVWRE